MGDPRKTRKKYRGPSHPWQKKRIEDEKIVKRDYAFKNKKEIWKMQTLLTNFSDQAKKITASRTTQAEIERKQLIDRLASLGLLGKTDSLEDVLGLTLEDILQRRLQTIVHKKGLARTQKQARQFIVHGHIKIGDKKVTSPSYIVRVDEENKISFVSNSALASEDHPERIIESPVQLANKSEIVEKEVEKKVKGKKETTVEEKPAKNKEEAKEGEKAEEQNEKKSEETKKEPIEKEKKQKSKVDEKKEDKK